MNQRVCLFSGGLDSTVLLYHYLNEGYAVKALSVHYGQRHATELTYAQKITKQLDIEHRFADISTFASWAMRGSCQTSQDIEVPNGHFTDPRMKITIIPNRNMIMLALAGAWAASELLPESPAGEEAATVALAVHHDDHTIYPDCRHNFTVPMRTALLAMSEGRVGLSTPFLNWSKAAIVTHGAALEVPFESAWSCYRSGPIHCGLCSACVERRDSFHEAGIADPTAYEAAAAA